MQDLFNGLVERMDGICCTKGGAHIFSFVKHTAIGGWRDKHLAMAWVKQCLLPALKITTIEIISSIAC